MRINRRSFAAAARPFPALSALDRAGGDDALALHCAATRGQDCGSDAAAIATDERD